MDRVAKKLGVGVVVATAAAAAITYARVFFYLQIGSDVGVSSLGWVHSWVHPSIHPSISSTYTDCLVKNMEKINEGKKQIVRRSRFSPQSRDRARVREKWSISCVSCTRMCIVQNANRAYPRSNTRDNVEQRREKMLPQASSITMHARISTARKEYYFFYVHPYV